MLLTTAISHMQQNPTFANQRAYNQMEHNLIKSENVELNKNKI